MGVPPLVTFSEPFSCVVPRVYVAGNARDGARAEIEAVGTAVLAKKSAAESV